MMIDIRPADSPPLYWLKFLWNAAVWEVSGQMVKPISMPTTIPMGMRAPIGIGSVSLKMISVTTGASAQPKQARQA